jgi:hypothetical protein
MRQGIGSLALCLLIAAAGVLPASAGTLTWTVTNRSTYAAQVSFYSQDRAAEWPGGGRSWDLFDHGAHTFTLRCHTGEKICYGAFVYQTNARIWGVGYNNSNSCTDCCGVCGAGSLSSALGE